MSLDQPQVAATRPPALRGGESHYDPDEFPEKGVEVRDIVRLFQCRLCSLSLREPVSLPCGKSICRSCLPQTHLRTNITYPANPERLQGFQCPFAECGKEHALEDCGVDVILNKASESIRLEIERGKLRAADSAHSTHIITQDPWAIAGIASLRDYDDSRIIQGGKLVATFILAEEGGLRYEAEVSYADLETKAGDRPVMFDDMDVLKQAQQLIRPEMDCQVCYALFYDPLTTACGHTFCRSCLHRVLDHSRYCPVCRRQLTINPLLNRVTCPPNQYIGNIIKTFWLDEVLARKATMAIEESLPTDGCDVPLFVCTLAFPMMPTFLHIFEPRYRLMIRRALEGDQTFGMVLPPQTRSSGPELEEFGTLLRIVSVQYFTDGRSLIETVGLSRFRVLQHQYLDGYIVGKTERIDDVSLEEEELTEANEATPELETPPADSKEEGSADPAEHRHHTPTSVADVATMSTQNLMQFATEFVQRMQVRSVPWLAERILSIYGECPNDPALFPWWFASMLPLNEAEKYRLLGTTSVRERMKICCIWIIQWEANRW